VETSVQASAQPSPQHFFETINAFQRTEALKAAIQLELFTAIAEGNHTVQAIAQRCAASERGVGVLCDAMVISGFLTKDRDHYALAPDSAVFLDARSPAYIGGTIGFLLSPMATEAFKDLTGAVRKGGTTREQNSLAPEHPMWVEFAHAMAPLMVMPAKLLAKMLGAEKGDKWRVLSLAAGHGTYEITIARQNPNAEVWGVDWANVIAVAQQNAKAAGVSDRYHTIPGSVFDVEFGAGYDIVLLTNFLHHFSPAIAEQLLRKVHAALKDGGKAVILEFVPNEDRVSPPAAAWFGLTMLAGTPDGQVYTFAELRSLLQKAGFRSSECRPMPPTFFSVVTGTK
jgi:ubiquinone/menaquinone biosynthesis C-methylase UbiE